jgi:outer membrane protein assembly factor BamB
VRWKAKAIDTQYSAPVAVADGMVYVGSPDQTVIALDARSGAQRWQVHLDVDPPFDKLPPFVWTVANGMVYVVSVNQGSVNQLGSLGNAVYALDAATGAQRWRVQTNDSLSAATVASGVLYFGSWSLTLYAFDAATGAELWQDHTGADKFSAPAVADGMIFEASPMGNGFVYALDAATRTLRWQAQAGNCCAAPTVAHGVVYVASNDNFVYAFDAATGAQRWRVHTGTENLSTPTVANGVVYFGSYDHFVYALDAATGALRWRFQTNDWILTAPTVANGVVYVSPMGSDHYVYALDAATGKLRWRFETGGVIYAPAVANGIAYVGSTDGFLYALNT